MWYLQHWLLVPGGVNVGATDWQVAVPVDVAVDVLMVLKMTNVVGAPGPGPNELDRGATSVLETVDEEESVRDENNCGVEDDEGIGSSDKVLRVFEGFERVGSTVLGEIVVAELLESKEDEPDIMRVDVLDEVAAAKLLENKEDEPNTEGVERLEGVAEGV